MAPLDRVRQFLLGRVNDEESLDEIRMHLRKVAPSVTHWLKLDLRDLDALLAQPQEPGLLARLVAFDANWGLDDPSDSAAKEFLQTIANLLRDVITEAEQQRSERLRQLGGGHG